jgi:ATP synthase (C/AC39) subunit
MHARFVAPLMQKSCLSKRYRSWDWTLKFDSLSFAVSTFNILHGFPEALVRGMRSSFLGDSDYHHLTQCETLDDVRLNMTESDYSECLADSSSMTPASLQKTAIEKVRRNKATDIAVDCE